MATIINNEAVSEGTKFRINNPLLYVPDPGASQALGLADLYFGEPSKDPEQEANQKRVYVAQTQTDGSLKAINQPVETSAGGVPLYNGSPALLAIDGNYSYKARSSGGELVYNFANVDNLSLAESGFVSIIEDTIRTTSNQVVITFPTVDLANSVIDISSSELTTPSQIDSRRLIRDIDYSISNGGTGTITLINGAFPEDTLVTARQNASTSQEGEVVGVGNVYVRPTIASAVATNFNVGDVVRIIAASASNDGLTNDYEVVPSTTGTPDGVNLIQLDNLNLLRLNKTRNKFQTYTEAVGTATIASGVLTIDANAGLTQQVTLTENISSINIANVNSDGATSIVLRLTQDATGSRSVSFSGFFGAGSSAPTLSTDANAQDIILFNNFGGSQFYVFSAGNDFGAIT
jgi:hypothetical protein